jgi:hypothetical protein
MAELLVVAPEFYAHVWVHIDLTSQAAFACVQDYPACLTVLRLEGQAQGAA